MRVVVEYHSVADSEGAVDSMVIVQTLERLMGATEYLCCRRPVAIEEKLDVHLLAIDISSHTNAFSKAHGDVGFALRVI